MYLLSQLSNREKNIWVALILDITVSLYFFPKVFAMEGGIIANGPELFSLIVKITIFMIVIHILSHIFFVTGKDEKMDERDHQFDAKAHRVAYIALVVGISLLVGQLVLREVAAEYLSFDYEIFNMSQVIIYLMLFLTLSSIVKNSLNLFFYCRGY